MKEAQALSLVGWVQNTDQGTVQGEAQGRPDKVAALKVRGYDIVLAVGHAANFGDSNTGSYQLAASYAA